MRQELRGSFPSLSVGLFLRFDCTSASIVVFLLIRSPPSSTSSVPLPFRQQRSRRQLRRKHTSKNRAKRCHADSSNEHTLRNSGQSDAAKIKSNPIACRLPHANFDGVTGKESNAIKPIVYIAYRHTLTFMVSRAEQCH